MDIWNIARVADRLEEADIAIDREATSLARWIWTDILALPLQAELELNSDKQQLLPGMGGFTGFNFKSILPCLFPDRKRKNLWSGYWQITGLPARRKSKFLISEPEAAA